MEYRYVEFLPPAGKFIFVTFFIMGVDQNCQNSRMDAVKVFSQLNTKFRGSVELKDKVQDLKSVEDTLCLSLTLVPRKNRYVLKYLAILHVPMQVLRESGIYILSYIF